MGKNKYINFKKRVFDIIQTSNGNDFLSSFFDWSIVILIILNVTIILLDTFNGIPQDIRILFNYFEIFSVIIFTIEYILRLWTSDLLFPEKSFIKSRIKFIFSFMAMVDLLAILPFYLPYVFPFDLRVLRMFRLLRLLRLFKVNRYTSALTTVGEVIKKKATHLLSSMIVVFILIMMSSLLMYSIENEAQPDVFENAFSGIWWAIATLTTVGYGDIYPVTVIGRILAGIIALLGIGLVAVPTGIISAGFVENMSDEKEENKEEKKYCPYCGKKYE